MVRNLMVHREEMLATDASRKGRGASRGFIWRNSGPPTSDTVHPTAKPLPSPCLCTRHPSFFLLLRKEIIDSHNHQFRLFVKSTVTGARQDHQFAMRNGVEQIIKVTEGEHILISVGKEYLTTDVLQLIAGNVDFLIDHLPEIQDQRSPIIFRI